MRAHASSVLRAALCVTAAAMGGVYLTGCGSTDYLVSAGGSVQAGIVNTHTCERAPSPDEAPTLIVLDWDRGTSPMLPDRQLAAFAVNALTLSGKILSGPDLEQRFRDATLARVRTMLCVLDPMDLAIIHGRADEYPLATIVHITGDRPPGGGDHIGQSSFDPCNEYAADDAVIWGGALATRIKDATFEQWVNAFANTIAHEIGHTIGFFHPTAESLARQLPMPSLEVMRANFTTEEILGEQMFLIEQETCPGLAPGSGSYALLGGDVIILEEQLIRTPND